MKNPLLSFLVVSSLLLSSCKEDEVAKEKITQLETAVAELKSDKVGLQADVISLKASQAGMSPGDAKALSDRKEVLEKDVQRLLPYEIQVKELTRQNEELSAKLAAVTMTANPKAVVKPGAAAAAGSEISSAVADSFVMIEGDHHIGGGFLAGEDGKVYLYTAASVFAGNQKLTIRTSAGQALKKFGDLELCDGMDMARMQVMDTVVSKLDMVELDAVMPAQLPVLALGMRNDTSAVAAEKATITSINGAAFSLDKSILQTAVGGPVIHALSGKVLGVIGQEAITPALWPNEQVAMPPKQVVTRLNQKITWVTTKIGGFLTESKRLQEFDDATRLASAVSCISYSGGMPQMDVIVTGSNSSARDVLTKYQDHSLAQMLLKWKGDDPNKRIATNEIDVKKKWRRVLSDGQSLAQRGIAEMKPAAVSWHYRAWAEASLKERRQVLDKITDALAASN